MTAGLARDGMARPDGACICVRDTGTSRGRGVFAARNFPAGELIEASPVVVVEARFEQLPIVLQRMVFSWRDADGTREVHGLALGCGSLYNGANPANVRYERDFVQWQIRFIAARDIECGEELTINYSAGDGSPGSKDDAWFDEHGIRTDFDAAR